MTPPLHFGPGAHTIAIDGLDWHVELGGTGPVVVLLHGTGGAAGSWHDVARALAPHCTVIVPEFPGHGRSALPAMTALTLEGFARGTAALCRALGVAPVLVAGHSAGAAVALQLVADGECPSLRHVVGINAALEPPPYLAIPGCDLLLRATFGAPAALDLVARLAARPGTIRRLLGSAGGRVPTETIARYEALFRGRAHAVAAYGMTLEWRLAPLLARFPSLPVPATFLVGTDDRWTPPRVSVGAARRLPHARVDRVDGAGHLLPEERPGTVADAILAILRDSGLLAPAPAESPAPGAACSTS